MPSTSTNTGKINMYINKAVFRYFLGVWLLILSVSVSGANFSKTELKDEQFLLLDIKNKDLLFLEAVDAYGIDGEGLQQDKIQILLPIASLLQSLELDFMVSTENATIKLTIDEKVFDIDLPNQTQSGPLRENTQPFLWSNEESELLVSHLLIEQLIDASLMFNSGLLAVSIEDARTTFPVERRLEREKRRQGAQTAEIIDLNKAIFADEFILDSYQLLSMPYVYNNINIISNGDQNTDTKGTYLLQSNFDFLYHNTNLTLNKQSGTDIATNLTFKRHQASPYETFALGIQSYEFGDVFGVSDNLSTGNKAGMGVSVARRPINYSRKFGTVTHEDMAPPGWEIELYRGGILLATSTVPADGQYVFEDVETLYGVNKFEIKLYGPFGEEDVHHKNIRINGTQLKQGEYGFNSYILDAGKKLLGGIDDTSNSFNPDSFGFAWDYGLFENISMGFNLTQTKDGQNNSQKFVGSELQTSIPGALFNLSLSHELGKGYAVLAAVAGQLGETNTYQLNYSTNKNFQLQNSNLERDLFSASISGRLLNISFNNAVSYDKNIQSETLIATNRLAGRLGKLSLTHNLNYRDTRSNRINGFNNQALTGDLSVAGRLGQDTRIAAGLTYDIKNNAKINQFRLSGGMRIAEQLNFNSQLDYRPLSKVKWRINNSVSWSSPRATFYSSFGYDADDQWSVSLGLTFSLGFDEYQDSWLFNSQNMTAGGTLDINSYLDQNNNHRLDEGDVALPGVRYGLLKQWENIQSNLEGKALLPFIPSYSPTQIIPKSTFGVVPSTRSYAVYTHPGGLIKAQIPFLVRTSVSGFVLLNDEEGEPLVNSNVLLTYAADNTVIDTTTDDDGYFEFNDLVPGDYNVMIDQKVLASRTLQSDPSSVQFSTQPAGGFLELGVIAAVPSSQGVSNAKRLFKATIYNYEPLEEVERLLGFSAQQNLIDDKNLLKASVNKMVLSSSKVLKASAEQLEVAKQVQQLKQSLVKNASVTTVLPENKIANRQAISGQSDVQLGSISTNNPIVTPEQSVVQVRSMEPSIQENKTTNGQGLPQSGYTIQLMVASSEDTLDQVIQTQFDDGFEYKELYQIEKRYQGQSMYVLLLGNYATRQLAEQSVAALPNRFKGKTWIRNIDKIRAESIN